ncbi:MAG: hypothetical protein DMD77_28305, partial [Candidatus Rokuibacteriota bacterium]
MQNEATIGIEAVDAHEIRDPAPLVAALDDHDQVDSLGNQGCLRRHVGPLRQPVQAQQCTLGGGRVHRG